ncbi:MAG TPA: hypothetical protein VMG55_06660 [Stellaceae bacterium]|nr:hypothetical protein [Stellaceae bacterium]
MAEKPRDSYFGAALSFRATDEVVYQVSAKSGSTALITLNPDSDKEILLTNSSLEGWSDLRLLTNFLSPGANTFLVRGGLDGSPPVRADVTYSIGRMIGSKYFPAIVRHVTNDSPGLARLTEHVITII